MAQLRYIFLAQSNPIDIRSAYVESVASQLHTIVTNLEFQVKITVH